MPASVRSHREGYSPRVFLILYEGTIVDELYDKITFTIPSSPDVPVQDLHNLVAMGYMDKKDAAKRIFENLNLPLDEITITEVPLLAPPAPAKKPKTSSK